MATFSGDTQVDALDALTVLSILEHADPLETMVTFMWKNYINSFMATSTLCLRCCCLNFTRLGAGGDGRLETLERVRNQTVFFIKVEPRGDTPCKRCGLLRELKR